MGEPQAVDPSDSLMIQPDQLLDVTLGKHFTITPQGLVVEGEPSYADCDGLWQALRTIDKALQFAIGDAAKYIRKRFGDKADQIISDVTGLSFDTVRVYEWTSDKVAPERRRMDVLDYSHHQAVAKLAPPEQTEWIARAAEGNGEKPWSVAQLKREIKQSSGATLVVYGVSVLCDDEADQQACCRQLGNLGRRFKPFTSARGGTA